MLVYEGKVEMRQTPMLPDLAKRTPGEIALSQLCDLLLTDRESSIQVPRSPSYRMKFDDCGLLADESYHLTLPEYLGWQGTAQPCFANLDLSVDKASSCPCFKRRDRVRFRQDPTTDTVSTFLQEL